MHNLTKIKLFRTALWITLPLAYVFVYPFVLLRKKNPSPLFFFFDRYAIGGAQRIHLDILKSVEDIWKQVYFTRKSPNSKLKEAFYSIPDTENRDIHFWCDNILFRLFSVHYYVFYINRHAKAHVLSSNSTFFYDMLPFFGKRVYRTELLHNFSYGKNGIEFFGLANHRYLDARIVYDSFTRSNILKQYKEFGIENQYNNRIVFIEPGVDIPPSLEKEFSAPLKVLYAGRGGPQKRIWLLNKIVEHFINNALPVEFHFAGTMMDELSEPVKQGSVLHGEISNKEEMNAIYKMCHAIILTSAYEGFPMVIKEGMAMGCIPVVTALEGNKMHLVHKQNSLLIDAVENEAEVITKGIGNVSLLIADPELTRYLSASAYEYAVKHFDRIRFLSEYRAFLLK